MILPLTPLSFLYGTVDSFPERLAVVCGETRWTYAKFGRYCLVTAGALRRLEIGPRDRVAYLSFNNRHLLAGYFAPLLIGAVFVPLHARLTAGEVAELVRQVDAKVVLVEADLLPLAAEVEAVWRSLGPGACPPVLAFDELGGEPLPRPALETVDESAAAATFFTSGSAAQPQPVTFSHRDLYLHAVAMKAVLRQTAVELHAVPLFHANGWGRPHLATLHGSTQVLLRRFTSPEFFRLLGAEGVTGTSLVPVLAERLLQAADRQAGKLQHLHIGGSPVPPALLPQLRDTFGWEVSAGYGLTEAGPVVATSLDGVRYTPLPSIETSIAADGELWVRASGDWIATGDLVRPEGGRRSFVIVDRKKDIIISGGENISSLQVEAVLARHPAVDECAVVAGPDPEWGEMPVAFVVLRPEIRDAEEILRVDLTAWARQSLAGFQVPRKFVFARAALPRTFSGKLKKRELRERL